MPSIIKDLITSFFDVVINFAYPKVCGFCDSICKDVVCNKCSVKIQKYMVCKVEYYYKRNFNKHAYLFKYKGIIRDKIVQYKFNDKPYIYESFVNLILKNKKMYRFLKNYDIIVAVPISKKRKLQRGYNQSELIAKKLAKKIENLEFLQNVLYKKIDTLPQSTLNKTQRQSNVKNAYGIRNITAIQNKKVLLFDDVFTTGSTVEECSKVLKNAEASIVDILTIAKD